LHDEVVTTCPRKYHITKVRRLKVTMYNTEDLYQIPPHTQFGPYMEFERGRCTVPGCSEYWRRFGYVVGCQNQDTSIARYVNGVWYSLPGRCPSRAFFHKSEFCFSHEPGGHCADPNGNRDCTWNIEEAGEVRMDEFEGLNDFNNQCKEGDVGYDPTKDTGTITNFWQHKQDPWKCSQREAMLRSLFERRAPVPPLEEPQCDRWP